MKANLITSELTVQDRATRWREKLEMPSWVAKLVLQTKIQIMRP